MSEGLKTLLEAAQYIEQQEKLKLSPQATAIPAILNEQQQQRFTVHAYDAAVAVSTTLTNGHLSTNHTTAFSNNNNNNNSINIRSSNIRHANAGSLQVSSSAPAAASTFQHVNSHQHHPHNTHHQQQQQHHHLHHNPLVVAPTNATTTTVLSNATNTAASTNGHHNPLHQHLNNHHLHHQQNSQLLNANYHDYEFNGVTVVASSPTGSTSGNLLTPLNSRSSEGCISDDANHNNNNKYNNSNTSTSTSFMLLTNATSSKLSTTPLPAMTSHDVPTTTGSTNTLTLLHSKGEMIGNAAASKQMLLANGIRIAAPSATVGQQQQQLKQQQQQQQQQHNHLVGLSTKAINDKNIPIITGFPYQLPPIQQSGHCGGVGGGTMILSNRHKTFTPLTPPPMSSRKFIEPTQSRIRSFSLSSHKFSANHQLHVQNQNSNNNNSMMVDDIPPTQQHPGYTTTTSSSPLSTTSLSQHSPRHASANGGNVAASLMASGIGIHFMSAGVAGTNHVSHITPRRRTISSTSNGAGTREVHNKLEKNRRAHLKECYESLKNELSLKDEDRRKTSNLAILGEAYKAVKDYQKRCSELEIEEEHLANEKINLQKRFASLRRELGPKYEQIFSGIFPDKEIGSIPSERETINDTHSLSSGRGSTLYSSSSSLSSGGSSGSNTMSSPVGAGLQTAMPTAISPVITKINNNNNNSNNMNSTSPISITSNNVVMQQQRKNPTITTTIQAVAAPTQGVSGVGIVNAAGAGNRNPPADSPTTLVAFGSSLPLSLTAKNISATSITRGSPTPSTPSPSPSSSSGVSSSSSLISSSPPINGVVSNGRHVTINIPNGLKLQAATTTTAAATVAGGVNGGMIGGIGATTSAGTIDNGTTSTASTLAPTQGVNNTNNAVLGNQMSQQQQYNGRKKSLTSCNSNNNNNNSNNNNNVMENSLMKIHHHNQHQQQITSEDGEQPAKCLKILNTTINGLHQEGTTGGLGGSNGQQKLILTGNGVSGGIGGSSNNNMGGCSPLSITNNCKSITNSSSSSITTTSTITATTNELCRLPGGAELNILPSNGLKSTGSGPVATAFYHANGKITFVNGPPPQNHHHHQQQQQHHPPSALSNPTITTTCNGTTVTNGFLLKDATPLFMSAASSSASITTNSVNGLQFAGNFAQLLAATNNTSTTTTTNTSINSNGHSTTASILPMTSFQNVAEPQTKNNSTPSIVTWRSGATTTN